MRSYDGQWREALERVVAKTGVERYRLLTSDSSPFPDKIEAYRRRVVELAGRDEQSYPPLLTQAGNVATALLAAARDGFKVVDQVERERRLEVCSTCPEFDASRGRCRRCGCVSKLKARVASSSCPIG